MSAVGLASSEIRAAGEVCVFVDALHEWSAVCFCVRWRPRWHCRYCQYSPCLHYSYQPLMARNLVADNIFAEASAHHTWISPQPRGYLLPHVITLQFIFTEMPRFCRHSKGQRHDYCDGRWSAPWLSGKKSGAHSTNNFGSNDWYECSWCQSAPLIGRAGGIYAG